jgi:hypothetical protein
MAVEGKTSHCLFSLDHLTFATFADIQALPERRERHGSPGKPRGHCSAGNISSTIANMDMWM